MSVDLVVDEVDGLEPETITPADRLQIDDIPVFGYRIYRAESALANKLLAMVEVHEGRPSSRVKDLVDVVVYAKACRIDSRTLAEQVANESRARKVNLPERFQIPDAWPAVYGKPYAKMARQAKVDDVAPDMVSAEELAAKLYEPVAVQRCLRQLRASSSSHWRMTGLYGSSLLGALLLAGGLGEKSSWARYL